MEKRKVTNQESGKIEIDKYSGVRQRERERDRDRDRESTWEWEVKFLATGKQGQEKEKVEDNLILSFRYVQA